MKYLPINTPTWATNANYSAGTNPWSSTPNRVAPTAGIAAIGFVPGQQPPAQYFNSILGGQADAIGLIEQVITRAALTNWQRVTLPNPDSNTTYYDIAALLPIRSSDTFGDRQRGLVMFGNDSVDSNKIYKSRSVDGFAWNSTASLTGAPILGTYAGGGEAGAVFTGNGSALNYSLDHGVTWTTAANFIGSHGVYYASLATLSTAVYVGVGVGVGHDHAVYTTSLAVAATNIAMPVSIVAGTLIDFADDGLSNILFCARLGSNTYWSICRSADAGVTWAKVMDMDVGSNIAGLTFHKSSGLFVACDSSGKTYTSPTGVTWTTVATTRTTASNGFTNQGPRSLASVGPAIAIPWADPGGLGGRGIAYSFDLGLTWNTWCFTTTTVSRLVSINNRLYAFDGLTKEIWISGSLGVPSTEL